MNRETKDSVGHIIPTERLPGFNSEAKSTYVNRMFGQIAPKYDLMNRLMTFGLDQGWRKVVVQESQLRSGGIALDVATGTGDIALTLIQDFPLTGAIIVSTPQQVAIADVRKAADMFRNDKINIPILGIVENMSYFSPPDDPSKRYPIFGQGGCEKLAAELNIPVLARLPIVSAIADSGDAGSPVSVDDSSPEAAAFRKLAENVAQQVAISNVIRETFEAAN